jgi:GTP-binding protein
VVALSGDRSFVMADVPGLIEGAHEGHGLGDQFLKHLERTKVLIHLVDVSGASGRDPVDDFNTIRRELELYNPELLDKPHLVAANKIDALDDPSRLKALEKRARQLTLKCFRISGVTKAGVTELMEAAWPIIARARADEIKEIDLDHDGDEHEASADYNPALVPPLRESKNTITRKKKR